MAAWCKLCLCSFRCRHHMLLRSNQQQPSSLCRRRVRVRLDKLLCPTTTKSSRQTVHARPAACLTPAAALIHALMHVQCDACWSPVLRQCYTNAMWRLGARVFGCLCSCADLLLCWQRQSYAGRDASIYVHPAAGRQICRQPLFADGGGGGGGRRGGIATPNTSPCLPVRVP